MPLPLRLALAGLLLTTHVLSAQNATGTENSKKTKGEWSIAGRFALETRWFSDEPLYPQQSADDLQASATLEPEFRWRSAERRHQWDFALFARHDEVDDERTHADVREASYRYVGDRAEVLIGVSRVFWGVAESRHLVDVVNQVDQIEDLDEEDRLGQPMLRLAFGRRYGRFELFSLLGFRERTFPGIEGRLRPPLPVDTDAALYESSDEDEHVDWAARWSHFLGNWDLGLSWFSGTGREPQFLIRSDAQALLPFYAQIEQYGADIQLTRGAWLWKLETLHRSGHGEDFAAGVFGFERTVYQLFGTAADLGLLLELHRDERDITAPPTVYDDDTFVGLRLAFNDISDTEILLGALVDNDDDSMLGILEASRRFGSRLVLTLEARVIEDAHPEGDLASIRNDSFVVLKTGWHW